MTRKHLKNIRKIIRPICLLALAGLFMFASGSNTYAKEEVSCSTFTTPESCGKNEECAWSNEACVKYSNYLPAGWNSYIRNTKTFASKKTGEELAAGFIKNAIRIFRYLAGGLALIMGLIYGMSLVFARGKEESISKAKTNFLWIFVGFIILIISENIAGIFNPETARAERLIDFNAARDQLRDAINYLKWIMGSIIVLLMTISGIQMITAQGEEEAITKQRRNLTWSGIGMLLILLADNIVNAIYVINGPDEVTAGQAKTSIEEVAGIIRLMLAFIGPLAIAFTIYAGFLYLTALENEERMQRAKRMIIGGVTGIIIIYASYTIVNTIASAGLTEPPTTGYKITEYVA